MAQDPDELPKLGSLAQSAHSKHLKQARTTMIAVGILTILANGAMLFFAESLVETEIKKELQKAGPQVVIDQTLLAEHKADAVRAVRLVALGTVVLGLVFIGLGIFVYRIPVVATATALVLYVGAAAIFGVLDPSSLAQGMIIKIIIVVLLVKALMAAIAYQREEQARLGDADA